MVLEAHWPAVIELFPSLTLTSAQLGLVKSWLVGSDMLGTGKTLKDVQDQSWETNETVYIS